MITFEIQLRTEDYDDEKREIITSLFREKAREIYAMALMLKEKRDPQIMFQTGDMFETNKDLELVTAEDLENY